MAAEDINIAFGKHLREIRSQLGLNQDDVAATCGIDPTSIRRLERGETNATLTTLFRLSKGLQIPLPDLMDIDQFYQPPHIEDDMIEDLRMQLQRLNQQEQQFILNFIKSFISLKNGSDD